MSIPCLTLSVASAMKIAAPMPVSTALESAMQTIAAGTVREFDWSWDQNKWRDCKRHPSTLAADYGDDSKTEVLPPSAPGALVPVLDLTQPSLLEKLYLREIQLVLQEVNDGEPARVDEGN